ncbi:TPA: HAD family hydrolase [Vibrio cholerae]|uniref:HAD family hydrolase n=1 Tax=Vibrio cholerae TaxID=666 RepID=UPI000E0DF68A|nr:HAD family phosphatase [Vibrio cholerae]
MAIRNVVFDVGNVIVKWAPQDIAQLTFGEGEESAFMAKAVFKSEFWRDLNKGKYTEAEVKRALHQQLGLSSDTLEQLFFHIKNTQVLLPGTLQLMDDLLKAGYRLYALTDNVNEIVAYLKKQYDFWPKFTGAVVSSECGLLKPDQAIYQHLADSQRILPQESVFMDDMPANVEGARQQGFHAIQFVDAHQARVQLAQMGLHF